MAVLKDKKVVGAPFSNVGELVCVNYNFADDTGAVADYDVLEADGDVLVQFLGADVKTAVTSAGALVMDLGKGAGGVEFLSDIAVATLALDYQCPLKSGGAMVELADGEKIVMGIEAFAATAGKINFKFMVYKRV